jgi:hypothetical protein
MVELSETPAPEAAVTDTPTGESTEPTATAAAMDTPTGGVAQATPTPSPSVSEHPNLVPVGEWAVNQHFLGGTFRARLTGTARGQQALEIVNRGRKELTLWPSSPDLEFFLAYFEVEYLEGDPGVEREISEDNFRIDVGNQLKLPLTLRFEDSSELRDSLLPGERVEGWVPVQVPIGGLVQAIGFVADPFDDNVVWFAVARPPVSSD